MRVLLKFEFVLLSRLSRNLGLQVRKQCPGGVRRLSSLYPVVFIEVCLNSLVSLPAVTTCYTAKLCCSCK